MASLVASSPGSVTNKLHHLDHASLPNLVMLQNVAASRRIALLTPNFAISSGSEPKGRPMTQPSVMTPVKSLRATFSASLDGPGEPVKTASSRGCMGMYFSMKSASA